MQKFISLILVMALLLTLCATAAAPAQAGQVDSPVGSDAPDPTSHKAYLPIISNGPGSSEDLIDQAVSAGTISAETGLIYKVFATFSDPRLPGQFAGAGIGRDGDEAIEQVIDQVQAGTLSQNAKNILTPFFIPPTDAGSWYDLSKATASPATAGSAQPEAAPAPADWLGLKSAKYKVEVIYLKTDAAAATKAQQLLAAFDAKIYSSLTTLMGRSPMDDGTGYQRIYLWNGYIDSKGATVPFGATTLGITVGARCDQSPTIIYLPSTLPIGDETHPGMIQYATHEFMHAIQFSYTIQNCAKYAWLKEATATWAEDFVYPNANSEWEIAPKFMEHPDWNLDAISGLHEYGAYLLPYYLTHQTGDNTIIRKIWENAATQSNSYLAIKNALPAGVGGNPGWQDYFWQLFLEALWNKAPFQQFYKTKDQLTTTVTAESDQVISAANGDQSIPLPGDFVTGGAMFYHFTVDSSVHSLTILNGLGKKLSIGDASETTYLTDGDQMYQSDDLSTSDATGATVIAMMKVAGSDWQAIPLSGSGGLQIPFSSHCVDVQGKIEELVIIQSNGDFGHPDTRTISPTGLPTTLFASNLPCWKVKVSSSYTIFNDGVTKVFSTSNAVYSYPDAMESFIESYPYVGDVYAYPETELALMSADVNWSVSGVDSEKCSYSGSGSFHVNEFTTGADEDITFFDGVLKGGPTYRGYLGGGAVWDQSQQFTYTVTGKDCPGSESDYAYNYAFLDIPLEEEGERALIKAPAGGGVISGSYRQNGSGGDYSLMTWSLTPQTK